MADEDESTPLVGRRQINVGLGLVASLGPSRALAQSPPDWVFHELHRRFIASHEELRGLMTATLHAVAHEDDSSLRGRVDAYTDRLLRHHRAEDVFVFPALRAGGRLRSSDVAFLDARDSEHRDVHRLAIELRELATGTGAPRQVRASVSRLASELDTLTAPHFEVEESVLTVPHLRSLLTAREIATLFEEIHDQWTSR